MKPGISTICKLIVSTRLFDNFINVPLPSQEFDFHDFGDDILTQTGVSQLSVKYSAYSTRLECKFVVYPRFATLLD